MLDGLVKNPGAGLVTEFRYSRHAGLVCQSVECRERQVTQERVDRLVHHCARFSSEIVNRDLACFKRERRNPMTVLPIGVLGKIPEQQTDHVGVQARYRFRQTSERPSHTNFRYSDFGALQRTRYYEGRISGAKFLSQDSTVNTRRGVRYL